MRPCQVDPTSPGNRRRDIQGLRAVAVLMVVAYHAGLPIPGGFVGVDVFFVISGYVITAMLGREWDTSGRIRFGRFYFRRFTRLTPALAVVVVSTMLVSAAVLSPLGIQQTAAKTAIGAMLLSANYVIATTTGGYFDAPAETNPLLNTWSLSVEEQFYLVFPAVLAFSWGLARRQRSLRATAPVVVGTIVLISIAMALLGSATTAMDSGAWWLGFYSPLTRAWEFAVGSLIALAGSRLALGSHRSANVAGGGGLCLLAAAAWAIGPGTPFPGVWTLLPVAGSALLIVAGSSVGSIPTQVLAARPMVAVGNLSYSIYLWHWPVIALALILWPDSPAIALLAAVLSLLPAIASYRFVEQPGRQLRALAKPRMAALVSLTVGVPVLTALLVWLVASVFWVPRIQNVVAAAGQMHAGYLEGCHFGPDNGEVDPAPCKWHEGARGKPVYLVGDSNAAHFVEGIVDATSLTPQPLQVTTGSSCPLLELKIEGPQVGYGTVCRDRVARVLAWLRRQPSGVVFVASSDEYWLDPKYKVVDDAGVEARSSAAKIALMRDALKGTVEQLHQAGHDVILIQTIPQFAGGFEWDPAKCSLLAATRGCPESMPLSLPLERSSAVRSVLEEVGITTGSRVLDLSDEICPGGICATYSGRMPVYRDGEHITVAKSHELGPVFAAALAQEGD